MQTLKSDVFKNVAGLQLAYHDLKTRSMQQLGLPVSIEPMVRICSDAVVLYRLKGGALLREASGSLNNLLDVMSLRRGNFILTVTF